HSCRLAHALVERGFAPSTPFAILSPNATLAMAAMLGGLRAGGAWSNTNFHSPAAVTLHILRRGQCEALFFHSSATGRLEEIRAGVPSLRFAVCLDAELPEAPSLDSFIRDASDTPINVRRGPDGVEFQGATGGTTGAPKITQGDSGFLLW